MNGCPSVSREAKTGRAGHHLGACLGSRLGYYCYHMYKHQSLLHGSGMSLRVGPSKRQGTRLTVHLCLVRF